MAAKKDGVQYFNHFFSNFLKPYGEAYFELNDDMIKKRIKPYNCNLINKPGLALSTMAASLNTNFDNMLLFGQQLQQKHHEKAKEIMEVLRPYCDLLNTKSINEDKSPRTIEHAIGVLTDYIGKSKAKWICKYMMTMYKYSSSMYQMSMHWIVSCALFNDVKFMADNIGENANTKTFKKSQTMSDYRKIALNELVGSNNLRVNEDKTVDLESDDGSGDESTGEFNIFKTQHSSTKKKSATKSKERRQSLNRTSEQLIRDLTSTSDNDASITKKPKRKNKKSKCASSDSADSSTDEEASSAKKKRKSSALTITSASDSDEEVTPEPVKKKKKKSKTPLSTFSNNSFITPEKSCRKSTVSNTPDFNNSKTFSQVKKHPNTPVSQKKKSHLQEVIDPSQTLFESPTITPGGTVRKIDFTDQPELTPGKKSKKKKKKSEDE